MATYLGTQDFTSATVTGVTGAAAMEDTAYQGSERTTSSTTYVDTTLATTTITGTGKIIIGVMVQAQMKTSNVSYTSSIQVFVTGTTLGDWSVDVAGTQPTLENNATEDWFTTTSTSFTAIQKLYFPVFFETVDATTTISLRIKTSNALGTNTIQGTRVRVVYG